MASLIHGVDSWIILKSLGSSGGTDILAVIFPQSFSVQLGATKLIFNVLVLVAAALLFSLEAALYALIYLYIVTRIVDLVVTGLHKRKRFFIVSPNGETISRRILGEVHRGVTILRGKGAYSEQEKQVLYAVINFREMPRLKKNIRSENPDVVVVVSYITGVMGHRIGNQIQW
ncbi:MAG: YitT family protein [Syntrophales bacterium]|nr:YitT family protein [Syntrophales bacterium]